MATKYDAFTNKGKTLISYDEWISKKQAEAAQSAIKTVEEEIKKLNLPQNTDVSKYGTYDTEIGKAARAKELYDSLSTYLSGLKVTNTGLKSSIDEINKSIQQNSAYYGGLSDYFNSVKGYYSKYTDQADFDNRVAERTDDLTYFILSNPDKNYKDFYSDFANRKLTELSIKGMTQDKQADNKSDPVAEFIKSKTNPNARTQEGVLNELKSKLETLTEEDAAELMTEYYALGNEEKRNVQNSFSNPIPQKNDLLSQMVKPLKDDVLKTLQPISNLNEQRKENKNREVRTYLSVAQGTQNTDLDKYTEANTENFDFGEYMTNKEKRTYSYLEDRFGEQFAKDYYSGLEEYVLRDRKLVQKVQSARDWGATNVITATLSWVANRGLTFIQGTEYLFADKDKATGFGEAARPLFLTSLNEALAAGAMEAVDWKIGEADIYDFLYTVGGSVVDSTIASFIPYGIGYINLGLASASSKYNEMVERGADISTALKTGLVAGLAEGIGEALSVGKIKSIAKASEYVGGGMLSWLKGALVSSGINISEEEITELFNFAYDWFENGKYSQYNTLVAEYSKTMSKEEAKKKASSDIAEQFINVIPSALFTGGMHYSISTIATSKAIKSANKIGANIKKGGDVQSYIQAVEEISNKLNLEELDSAVAKDLETAITKAKEKDSDHNIGALSVSINRAVNEQNINDIQNILSSHTNESLDLDNVLTGKESVTNLAKGITNRAEYAQILNAAIQGKTLTQKEMKTLKSAVHYEEIYNRVTSDPDIVGRTEATMLMNGGVNAVKEIFDKYSSSNSVVDSNAENGYNENRGGINELSNRTGALRGNQQPQETNSGGVSQSRRTWEEDEESFVRRTQENQGEAGRGRRILVKNGNSHFAYTPAKSDNSEASRAVDLLKSIGIDAIYCEGDTESNKNGKTTVHSEAVTTPDGKVYVSSNSSLSSIHIAAHEAVHVNDFKQTEAYKNYESVVNDNVLWGTDAYFDIANRINQGNYGGKYDINDISFANKFIRELTAYVNEFVSADIDKATEIFSPMFKDWDAVVEASKQFNKDIGADFSESALLMPQNDSTDSSSDESMITEPTVKKAEADPVRDYVFELSGRQSYTPEQLKVVTVARKFGRKVIFEDTIKTQGFRSDGYFDSDGNIHLDYDTVKPLEWVLKHELTHFGEGTDAYNEYVDLLRKTKIYKKWLQKELKTDEKSLGKLEGLMRDKIITEREAVAPINPIEAQAEIIANFSATFAFAKDSRGIEALTADMSLKEHNALVQFILDFISYLKKKLGGSNKTLTKELSVLEDRYIKMLTYKAQNPTTEKDSRNKYSFSDSNNGLSNDKLISYDNELEKLILNRGDYIINSKEKLIEVVNMAFDEPNKKATVYFGIIPSEILQKIEKDIPNLPKDLNGTLFKEGKTYSVAATLDSIQHLTDDKNLSRKDIVEYLDKLADTIIDYDAVHFNYYNRGKESSKGVLFDKVFDDGTYTSFEIVSNNKRSLNLQTMYLEKGDYTKKKSAETLLMKDSSANVQDVGRSDFTDSISQFSPNSQAEVETQDSEVLNSENNSKIQYSIPTEADELFDRYESGEISRDEFMSEVEELYNRSVDTFGPIKRGEKAQEEINVPRRVEKDKKTHRFVRTIIESDALTDEMLDDVKTDIILGNFSYKAISDENAKKKADQYIKNGRAESVWDSAVNGSPVHISKETIAVGEKLLMEAVENNDRKRALELSGELCDVLTRAGQVVQAARMLKQMTGLGKLMTVQRMVKTINKDLAEKYGEDKAPFIRIDEVLAEQLANLKPGQEYEIVFRNIMEDVAAQMPSTFLDKWNAWRYFAMLANPRTHIRNMVGNGIFIPAVRIKDFMAAGMEAAFVHDTSKRTKSVVIKPEYMDFAKEDVKKREAKAMLSGNGQLDDRSSLEAMKKIFETEWLDKAVKGNTNLMEAEDMLFKSIHYRHALAGFLQARKVDLKNVDEKTLNEAREYAVNEAKKATFQDFSYAAELINHVRLPEPLRRTDAGKAVQFAGQVVAGGLLPFKRTPINILKRGVEYSPLGLAQTTIRGLYQVCKGDFNVSQFCDGLAANLTGTGLLLLGMLLCSQGLVTGGFDDDEEDRIKKLNGEQEYSVKIFGKSFTLDWAAPACIPFFIGVEVINAMSDAEDFKFSSLTKAFLNALEPMTNLSMLSGIQSVISAAAYADDSQKLAAIVSDIVLSYASQGIPSVLGSVSRTIDSTQRSWYKDKNSQFDTYAQTLGNTVASKVPGLSYLQIPSFDEWGRTKSRGNLGERIVENFISPGYYSSVQYDEVETELKKIFEATGKTTFPTAAGKSFKVNGETKYLTADEYVAFAQAKGEMSFEYVKEFVNSPQYAKLTDGEKAKVISDLYKYATAKAKAKISDYNINDEFKTVSKWEKNGKSVVTYYIGRALDN